MSVSVVIPTYNRVNDVREVFKSLLLQNVKPQEVIIVDDSDNNSVEKLCNETKIEFEGKEINLKYVRNEKCKSLTVARNIGVEHASSDIVLFLDDDVVLDENYIMEILSVFDKYSDAFGVQGMATNVAVADGSLLDKLLLYYHTERDGCRVLPSAYNTYPFDLKKIIQCQWLSGCNQSYRKEILKKFKFDENMKRYCFKEDMDLSYRIFKEYPNSLYMTPKARLVHNYSKEGRLPNRDSIYMKQVHTFYFFFKNIDQDLSNKLLFIWSVTGLFLRFTIKYSISLVLKPSKNKLLRLKYFIDSHIFCLAHLEDLKNCNLERFNKTLVSRVGEHSK